MTTTPITGTRLVGGVEHAATDRLLPAQARAELLDAVLDVFDRGGVPAFVVRADTSGRVGSADPHALDTRRVGSTVAVRAEHRGRALSLLADLAGPGMHVREAFAGRLDGLPQPLSADTLAMVPRRCDALLLARLWSVADGLLDYGFEYGCLVEFWSPPRTDEPGMWQATTPNVAGRAFHEDYLTPATITVEGRERPSVAVFDRTFLDDVTFPIDAVYTWVDGDDPVWRERMLRARAEAEGVDFHPEAQAANRFQSRDELKYSLRSLEMYAPWIRHVYLVTDGQVPSWLDTTNERLTVVDHRDIYADPTVLPVFNSSAIITQLHHIEGLAEHYLYFNDDMFLGSDARPEQFWFGSGIAKVFSGSLPRAFGPAHHGDAPHFNITKNIRSLMEAGLGRSVTQAIQHTPYPQRRSVNYEIEERFGDVVNATAGHRFRHHEDIALDQLFHYYAQATGRAVPSHIDYRYLNVGVSESLPRLRRLLAARDATVFCLNDAPEPGTVPVPIPDVVAFLESYFPMTSEFEKR